MDLDKVFERIMLLKLIQSSGVETPYEMNLNLVGEVLFGKNYKIFTSTPESESIADIFCTVKIEPRKIPIAYIETLKTFVFFFRKNEDLHLVHIRSKRINRISFMVMEEIGAERVYWNLSDSGSFLISHHFSDIENIYYHPIVTLSKDRLTFSHFVKQMCYNRNRVADLINGGPS